jgi:uncharacterized protein (UPF0332 family)
MIVDIDQQLALADDKLRKARKFKTDEVGEYSASQSEAYEAMLAATRARLGAGGMNDTKTHNAAQSGIGLLYGDDETDQNPQKVLRLAYQWKVNNSYTGNDVSKEEADEAYHVAQAFVSRISHDTREILKGIDNPRKLTPAMLDAIENRSRQTRK